MDEARPAGFWIRLAAHAVDGWIFLALALALVFSAGLVQAMAGLPAANVGLFVLAGFALLGVANGVYYTALTKNGGQTLGKRLVGIKVVGLGGGDVSLGRALARWAAYALSYAAVYLGYLWAALGERKSAWHDRLTATRVVEVAPCSAGLKWTLAVLGLVPAAVPILLAYSTYASYNRFKVNLAAAREVQTYRGLSSLRSAVDLYDIDKARYPASLSDPRFLGPYIAAIPDVRLEGKGHAPSAQVDSRDFLGADGRVEPAKLKDTGHWLYNPGNGRLIIDCTHESLKGNRIYEW